MGTQSKYACVMHENSTMPTLQIRNLPQELYDQLKESARESKRSMTQQAILLLQKSLESSSDDRKRKVTELQALNEKISQPEGANIEEIMEWIKEDRNR